MKSSEEDLARALQFRDEVDWVAMAEHLRGLLEGWPDDATVLCWLSVAERELGDGRGRLRAAQGLSGG